ncbi:MAG: hypothetical protein HY331_13215 [Chloroflexi bacterium]|nr:hypothetical protein [Chloroflexota bacterium]
MDPASIDAESWSQLFSATRHLALAVGLTINGAMALLLGLGIIPSLHLSDEVTAAESSLRPVLYLIAAGSWLVALASWGRGFSIAIGVLQTIYPSFLI